MKVERLRGQLEDGKIVTVIKTTPKIKDAPHLDGLPTFTLEDGEHLNPDNNDKSLKYFVSYRTNRKVTIIG